MNRREILNLAPAAAAAGILGSSAFRAGPAHADAHTASPGQVPGIWRHRIGDWTLTALSDGWLPITPDALGGIDADGFARLMQQNHRDPGASQTSVNAFLLQTGDRTILIDAGTGFAAAGFGDTTLDRLPGSLDAAGIAPADVTDLLVTHLHPDHIGGAFTAEGAPVFENAGMIVGRTEHDFWTDEAVYASVPAEQRGFFDLARGAVAAYGDRVNLISGPETGIPGITAMDMPGHTPGHLGLMIENGGARLLVWGDIVHVPGVQFDRPEVTIAFDTDPEQAAATRARVFDMAATDGVAVAGMHLPFPAVGYVETRAEGYGYAAQPWTYF